MSKFQVFPVFIFQLQQHTNPRVQHCHIHGVGLFSPAFGWDLALETPCVFPFLVLRFELDQLLNNRGLNRFSCSLLCSVSKGKQGIFPGGHSVTSAAGQPQNPWNDFPPLHPAPFPRAPFYSSFNAQLNPPGLPQKGSREPLGSRCGMFRAAATAGEEAPIQRFRRSPERGL